MKIIIVGASKVGSQLASIMAGENHSLTVIDRDPESFRRLARDFPGRLVQGTGIDEGVLEDAGIKEADAVVAVTNNVNANLMIAQIARVIYKVARVATILPYDDPLEQFSRKLGIKIISLPRLGAKAIERCIKEVPEKCI
ncbi:MAG TPA: NAD-binding protein [Spirochaetia bacterium]|nr:NAD-binding protein [Spirochaetia bacterium]